MTLPASTTFAIDIDSIHPASLTPLLQQLGRSMTDTAAQRIEAAHEADPFYEGVAPYILESPQRIQLKSGQWRLHIGGVLWPHGCAGESDCFDIWEKLVCGGPDYLKNFPGGYDNVPPSSLIPYMVAMPGEIAEAVVAIETYIHTLEDRFPFLGSTVELGKKALSALKTHPGVISEKDLLASALAPLIMWGLSEAAVMYMFEAAACNVGVQRGLAEIKFTRRRCYEVVLHAQ